MRAEFELASDLQSFDAISHLIWEPLGRAGDRWDMGDAGLPGGFMTDAERSMWLRVVSRMESCLNL